MDNLINDDFNTEVETPETEIEATKEPVIGKFKPKDKFLEFCGGKGVVNYLSNEATIEAKHLSGLDLDGITLKLTICDEGTVNLEEVDGDKLSEAQLSRLVEIISEKTITPYRQRMVITELPFRSVQTVKDKHIPLYLVVDYQKPIDKLASLFDEEVEIEPVIEISDTQSSKLDAFLSLFDDEPETQSTEKFDEIEVLATEVKEEVPQIDFKKQMEEQFAKLKQEKIDDLSKRLSNKEKELTKFKNDISQSEKKVKEAEAEVKLLQSRLDDLKPQDDPNGFYFNVSERMNERITLEPEIAEVIKSKVSKIKSINVDAFMKLFEDGEYQIRLGKMNDDNQVEEFTDYESLPEDVKSSLRKLGTQLEIEDKDAAAKAIKTSNSTTDIKVKYRLFYIGEMSWGDIVNKMVKMGFAQDADFDKQCGSNSYKIYENDGDTKNINKFEDFDKTNIEKLEDISEELEDFENQNGYPIGDEFLFSIYENNSATNEIGDPQIVFSVSPKSYFEKEGFAYDQHLEWILKAKFHMLKQMGDGFEELEEGLFDFVDEDNDCCLLIDETVDLLCKAGLIPSISYQNLCSSKDTQLLIDTLEKLGHKNLLIP